MKQPTHVPDLLRLRLSLPALLAALWPIAATAQTSFLAPDGKNRFPAVTIFCPSGNSVAPCSFGAGGGNGGGVLTVGGQPVSATNRLPTADPVLDGLVNGGALGISGTVALSGTPTVTLGTGTSSVGGVSQAGAWTVGLAGGNNAIGSVSVSNLPASQAVTGIVGLSAGSAVSVSNLPATQAVTGTVGLSAGTAIAIANLPAVQTVAGSVGEAGNWSVGLAAGSNQIGTVGITNFPVLGSTRHHEREDSNPSKTLQLQPQCVASTPARLSTDASAHGYVGRYGLGRNSLDYHRYCRASPAGDGMVNGRLVAARILDCKNLHRRVRSRFWRNQSDLAVHKCMAARWQDGHGRAYRCNGSPWIFGSNSLG